MVFDQHPGQSRWRSARRSGFLQDQGRDQAQRAGPDPAAAAYPDLYKDLHHVVRINYYKPRGDAKEGWDNIDIFGWLGYPMQIKLNFLCRDSILAAPSSSIWHCCSTWRSAPKCAAFRVAHSGVALVLLQGSDDGSRLYPEHDIFIQLMKLKNTLRWDARRRPHHPLGSRVLRLGSSRKNPVECLVIGGTAFIGRALVAELLKAGHAVRSCIAAPSTTSGGA
ncbi:MAG: hypothetical protein WDO18_03770 [Acidobacteriota bacterium]